ncbi:hypothetical protein SBA3_1450010 [Candidatus Sulfopaludibacter sp. SbA3]|nr:hypothetical protein SBA3_1450010 [Candidatus Sulfopaludibacter sp. SbA3]
MHVCIYRIRVRLVWAAGTVSVVLRGGGMLGHVSGRKPRMAAALPVRAPRMVLAVADLLEETAHAHPPPIRRAQGSGSRRLSLRPLWDRRSFFTAVGQTIVFCRLSSSGLWKESGRWVVFSHLSVVRGE